MRTASNAPAPLTTTGPAISRRRYRATSVIAASGTASLVYLVASAASVDFRLTDPGATASTRLNLATIAVVAAVFGLLGWVALAALERYTRHARQVWTAVAVTVLALSFVAISVEHATPATKLALSTIHLAVAAVLISSLPVRGTDDSTSDQPRSTSCAH